MLILESCLILIQTVDELSSFIDQHFTVVFYFIDPDKIVFIDIGNHDQVY
ncbi:hypothetical protein [Cyanobacterium aponinum]|nr:hypothetical protein [Cyanobacterium aponinum]